MSQTPKYRHRVVVLGPGVTRVIVEEIKETRVHISKIQNAVETNPDFGDLLHGSLNRWQHFPLSVAFDTWRDNVQQMQHLKDGAANALFKYAGSLSRKAWMAWRSTMHMKQQEAHKLSKVIYAMGGFKMARAFYWWRVLTQYLQHMKGAMTALQAKVNMRRTAIAFYWWQHIANNSRKARRALGRLAFKRQHEVLEQWRAWVVYSKENKAKMKGALAKMFKRLLNSAFQAWKEVVLDKKSLQNTAYQVIQRITHRSLARAWAAWCEMVEEAHAKRDKMATCLTHFRQNALSKAWHSWRAYHAQRLAEIQADVKYYGGLLDKAFFGWLEVAKELVQDRGSAMFRMVQCKRMLRHWRQWVHVQKANRQLVEDMAMLRAFQCVKLWRHTVKARKTYRVLLLRRGLLGWHDRVRYWVENRHKMAYAARVFVYGSMARCFEAWHSLTHSQSLKREVFAEKQRRIQEALRVGDQIRQRRRQEMLLACLQAWHLQTGIFRQVRERFMHHMNRVQACWFEVWRRAVQERRLKVARAEHHFRLKGLRKYMLAWVETATALAERHRGFEDAANEAYFAKYAGAAMEGWLAAMDLAHKRREALVKVFKSQIKAQQEADKELMGLVLHSWKIFMTMRADLGTMAEMASSSRRLRVMGEVFMVWYKYTQAMKADVDPASPFLSPRSPKESRTLIRRTAAMLGMQEVDIGSDESSEIFVDIPHPRPSQTGERPDHRIGMQAYAQMARLQSINGRGEPAPMSASQYDSDLQSVPSMRGFMEESEPGYVDGGRGFQHMGPVAASMRKVPPPRSTQESVGPQSSIYTDDIFDDRVSLDMYEPSLSSSLRPVARPALPYQQPQPSYSASLVPQYTTGSFARTASVPAPTPGPSAGPRSAAIPQQQQPVAYRAPSSPSRPLAPGSSSSMGGSMAVAQGSAGTPRVAPSSPAAPTPYLAGYPPAGPAVSSLARRPIASILEQASRAGSTAGAPAAAQQPMKPVSLPPALQRLRGPQ